MIIKRRITYVELKLKKKYVENIYDNFVCFACHTQ